MLHKPTNHEPSIPVSIAYVNQDDEPVEIKMDLLRLKDQRKLMSILIWAANNEVAVQIAPVQRHVSA